jgi:hypothetical protein
MADDRGEAFLSRWSRLKHERAKTHADEAPVADQDAAAPAPLPPVEALTPQSDFTAFMHPKVEDALRRVALKKLFSDPHFNVPDPYEAYSGDWTGGEAIPEAMLASLEQRKTMLRQPPAQEPVRQAAHEETGSQEATREPPQEAPKEEQLHPDEPGRQDA